MRVMTWKLLLPFAVLLLASCANTKLAQEHNKTGLSHLQNDRFSEAESEFGEAVKLEPKTAVYKSNLGVTYSEHDRLKDAENALKEAIALDNGNALYHRNLGDVYLKEVQLDSALSEYQRAFSINPGQSGVHDGIIKIAFDTNDMDKWIQKLDETARNTKPDNPKGVDTVFFSEQAMMLGYTLQGKYDETIARATGAIDTIRGVKTEQGGTVIPIILPGFIWIHKTAASHINTAGIVGSLYAYRGLSLIHI